ncbi:hypothetical protein B0A55_07409 [Friedmanniomyces simplex]|uniref:ASX DEUBAD domain-containing protein n=1 Tax=Friedmanniomyces simplex TaxID=329884 RepID=A0A4U0WY78_9PEZI|nr:hypothetical protein B0A55_07409 [Friedmanniomyces simplex]
MSDKRLLTAERSKLGVADLATILRKEGAWDTLALDTRENLYALLPATRPGEPPHDPDVNPLKTPLRPYIEEELRIWQDDLKYGKEAKKWREEAMLAGVERREGKYDEWKESEREREFGGVKRAGSEGAENGKGISNGEGSA